MGKNTESNQTAIINCCIETSFALVGNTFSSNSFKLLLFLYFYWKMGHVCHELDYSSLDKLVVIYNHLVIDGNYNH